MIKVLLHPLEYFPRIEYCALAMRADVIVLGDTLQYSRQSYQNRTRLRNPSGSQWLSIPLEGGYYGRAVRDVDIEQNRVWRGKHWRAMQFNYRSSPYFEYYEHKIEPVYQGDSTKLGEVTLRSTQVLHDLLEIKAEVVLGSTMGPVDGSLGALVAKLPDGELLLAAGMDGHPALSGSPVSDLAVLEAPYRQNFPGYEANMSGLDLVFNLGPESQRHLLGLTEESVRKKGV